MVAYVARQLGIADPACFAQYCAGEQRWEHAAERRRRYGYRDFASGTVQWRLNRWLYALCWSGTDRPSSYLTVRLPGCSCTRCYSQA